MVPPFFFDDYIYFFIFFFSYRYLWCSSCSQSSGMYQIYNRKPSLDIPAGNSFLHWFSSSFLLLWCDLFRLASSEFKLSNSIVLQAPDIPSSPAVLSNNWKKVSEILLKIPAVLKCAASYHRMVQVGRDLKGHLIPTTLPQAGTPSCSNNKPLLIINHLK